MGTQEQYWELIEGKNILAIEGGVSSSATDIFDQIHFYVDGYRLSVSANEDTDEIVLSIEAAALPSRHKPVAPTLQKLIGREFFWLWSATNSQGYRDTVMMSFASVNPDDIALGGVPEIAFVGVASKVQVLKILAPSD